ncbi:MAG: alpha/beta fold hydrolase [Acidobacteria bacterium]|nr:alpha/beta fold hydrolase [Acidobacteriota bacterium]
MAYLVFIHGAGDSSAAWSLQTTHYAGNHRTLAINLPGHGARLAETGNDRHEANADEICRLMDQASMARAVVVGHSMGGGVALTLALNHPARVRALVLVATGARLKMRPDFIEAAAKTAAEFGNRKPAHTHIIPAAQMVHPDIPALVVRTLESMIGDASAQATYGDFQANNNFDVMARLPEIKVPTLVIGGDADKMAPENFCRFLADGITGARLEMLSPCGHYPQVEQEQAFHRALDAFLSSLPA